MNNKVTIYHNIMWSKYKAIVFNSLYKRSLNSIKFIQIAESEKIRNDLSAINKNLHNYPYKLLYSGNYDKINKFSLILKIIRLNFYDDSKLVIAPGYHKIEYWFLIIISKLSGKKVAIFCDSTKYDNKNVFYKKLLKIFIFKFSDGFFCYGQRSSEYLKSLGVKKEIIYTRCQSCYLPIDYSIDEVIKKRKTKLKSNIFLYVGRLSPEKGLNDLFEAFKLYTNLYKNSKLRIVGNGKLLEYYKSLVCTLNIQENVIFVGSLEAEDIYSEYINADCLILPSYSEPWGLVVNEALSYGCPVIVSNNCGCVPELVENKKSGIVFEAGNIINLKNSMLESLNKFSDSIFIANYCIRLILDYNPDSAADAIDNGCNLILNKSNI